MLREILAVYKNTIPKTDLAFADSFDISEETLVCNVSKGSAENVV